MRTIWDFTKREMELGDIVVSFWQAVPNEWKTEMRGSNVSGFKPGDCYVYVGTEQIRAGMRQHKNPYWMLVKDTMVQYEQAKA